MVGKLLRRVGRFKLCGLALLVGASLVNAQQGQWQPAGAMASAQPPAPAPIGVAPAPQTPPAGGQIVVSPEQLKAMIDAAVKDGVEKQIKLMAPPVNPIAPAVANPTAPAGSAPAGAPANFSAGTVRDMVMEVFQEKAKAERDKELADKENYKVGTDLRMFATWKNGLFLETPNKDFYIHIGGEVQYDNDFFGNVGTPAGSLTAAKGAAAIAADHTGMPQGGIGQLVDADYFRRLRIIIDGGFWEVGEFMFQPKLEKVISGQLGLDEVWAGVKDIPFLGTIRVGHHKTPQGLESDDWSSNQTFTYMERSSMSNAFFQNFGTGIVFTNNIAQDWIGQRATYAAMFYRPQDGDAGATYADGDYAFTGRLSGLLIDQNEGRHLLHVAASYTYRHNRNGNATISCTPEMYDYSGGDNGYGTVTSVAGATGSANAVSNMAAGVQGALAGNTNPNSANATALLSTGAVTSTATSIVGTELLYICGPFSVQAEYSWLTLVDTQNAGGGVGSTGNITFSGGYVALSYIITGENRTYDYRLGRLGTNYLTTNTPFWLVRDGGGNFNFGWGAWELEARFSHLDLNSSGVNGGVSDALNLGVVWHLNDNLRVFVDYLHQDRYNCPTGINSGWIDGFGIRTQVRF